MSIFINERIFKKSEVENVIEEWYKINLENSDNLPSQHKDWGPFVNKLTHIQYKVLRMMFELDPVEDIKI